MSANKKFTDGIRSLIGFASGIIILATIGYGAYSRRAATPSQSDISDHSTLTAIVGFLIACFCGWVASLVLLDFYEMRRPHYQERLDEAHQKEITDAIYKMAFRSGIAIGLIWLLYYVVTW